ncbi:hypothetical protein SUGI_0292860 [Cryptomeria japonica]|nr:hypothetical protein SUGI_0292860 [Cryptomeria japonica]
MRRDFTWYIDIGFKAFSFQLDVRENFGPRASGDPKSPNRHLDGKRAGLIKNNIHANRMSTVAIEEYYFHKRRKP